MTSDMHHELGSDLRIFDELAELLGLDEPRDCEDVWREFVAQRPARLRRVRQWGSWRG